MVYNGLYIDKYGKICYDVNNDGKIVIRDANLRINANQQIANDANV